MIFLEPSEVLSVLRAAKAKGSREWAMISLAYKHGLRASEVCNLRLDDIDLKNGSLIVDRLKGSLRTVQAVTEHRGEPLLNEVKALGEWLRQRHDDGSDYLFTSQKGGRLDRSQFFRLFRDIACQAGLSVEKQHPHALKHSIASHLVSANVNLVLVKQHLGHKSIASTNQPSTAMSAVGLHYAMPAAGPTTIFPLSPESRGTNARLWLSGA
jgi:integrase